MKRTRNMVYVPSIESRELVLYADNNRRVYDMAKAVAAMLKKHAKRGVYDSEKAVDAWYPVATLASDEYKREFGYGFSVTDRFTAAVEFEEEWREEILG